jgi:O-antigen/teichoic acid export membrane protein
MERPAESAALSVPLPCEMSTPRSGIAWRMRWGALWVVGGRLAGIGVTLLANVILARQLGPEEYGKFTLLSTIIALLSLCSMLGLSGAVVRFIPESLAHGQEAKARQILRLSFAIMSLIWGLVSVAVVSCWSLIAAYFFLPQEIDFVLLVTVSGGFIALLQLTAESLRSFHELRFASLLAGGQTGGLLSNTIFVAMFLAWGLFHPVTLQSALCLNVIALLAVTPLALLFLFKTVRQHQAESVQESNAQATPERPQLTTILAVCVPIMLVQCVTMFATQADVMIAGAFCESELGLYSAARRLMVLVAMPLQMVNFLVISSIAEFKAKKRLPELENLLQTTGALAAIPAVLALLLLVLVGGPILELLFGGTYREAALPLAILAGGQFVLVWAGSSHTTLLMTGQQNLVLGVNTVSALLLLGCGSLAANYYGMVGLAIVSSSIVILENLVLMMLVRKLLGIHANVPLSWAKWSNLPARLQTLSGFAKLKSDQSKQRYSSNVEAEAEHAT